MISMSAVATVSNYKKPFILCTNHLSKPVSCDKTSIKSKSAKLIANYRHVIFQVDKLLVVTQVSLGENFGVDKSE